VVYTAVLDRPADFDAFLREALQILARSAR
jgi:hypothetical protein